MKQNNECLLVTQISRPMLKYVFAQYMKIHIFNTSVIVIHDENIGWKSNTDALCKKLSSGIYALKHIKEHGICVQPHFSSVVKFGMYSRKLIDLQKLHNRAACIIAHMPNEVDQQTVPSIIG